MATHTVKIFGEVEDKEKAILKCNVYNTHL